jgi:tRNA (mo5U34)-methyltransferase
VDRAGDPDVVLERHVVEDVHGQGRVVPGLGLEGGHVGHVHPHSRELRARLGGHRGALLVEVEPVHVHARIDARQVALDEPVARPERQDPAVQRAQLGVHRAQRRDGQAAEQEGERGRAGAPEAPPCSIGRPAVHARRKDASLPRVDVLERARELKWYHALELAPGQLTDGVVDLRPYVPRMGLPERMDGMRVLDVGTFDGFWAFELERRGADVVAIDVDSDEQLDWPTRRRPPSFAKPGRDLTFALAREQFGSKVERHAISVYDATPEELGTFDLVFCGSVLIHLRDQLLALERIANLCDGLFISAEAYHRRLSVLPFAVARYQGAGPGPAVVFWEPNLRGWKRMIETAGFGSVECRDRFDLRALEGWKVRHAVWHARK